MMKQRTVSLLTLLVVLSSVHFATAQTSVPPRFTVDEILKLRRVSDPQLSPDGTRVAYVVTDVNQQKNTRNNDIWIVPLTGGMPVRLTQADQSDDRPRWSPDGKQIAFISARDGGSQVWVMGADDPARARKLTSLATEASGVTWSPDGKWLAFLSDVYPDCATLECSAKKLKESEESPTKARLLTGLLFRHWVSWKDDRFSHLFVMPADGASPPRDLTPGAADVPPFSLGGPEGYAFSADSKEIAFVKKTDKVEALSTNSDIFTLEIGSPTATPRKVTTNPAADEGPVYSPDGRFILYRAQARAGFESDRWELMLFDRQSGQHRSITRTFDRSADGYVWSPDSKTIYVSAEDNALVPIFALDVSGTSVPKPIVREGSNGDLQVSRDGRTLVFSRSSLQAPPEIFRATQDGAGVTMVTQTNAAFLQPFKLSQPESVWYTGASGTRVHAWIVKPASFQAGQKYPLLFLVHGGPQGAWGDGWSYRWNPQVFASEGYIAFLPNPRGSTGFGQKFTDQISGDWGGRVYEDLMKGLDYAEALPYVDRARIGAAGASYGGYMMNWFLGHTDRFKAVVSHAGVYNLTSMYGVTEELWFPEWDLLGTPWTNPEAYAKWSPHMFARNFKTPTLVTHGELDFRVPIGEGFQLFTTLQRLNVPSKMLYFPDEGHWINKPANSALWYRTVLDWMNQWVKK